MSLFYALFAAAFVKAWGGGPPVSIDEYKGVLCLRCGDSGFSGHGTGYGDVCSECGGQSAAYGCKFDALHAGYTAFMGEVRT